MYRDWIMNIRRFVQFLWAILTNSYIYGFINGKIYASRLKSVCLPGLNCYSCPGSLGACPIGGLQAVLGSASFHISYYLLGFFLIIGTFLGRFVCGFLCPFGLIQELLHKIPFPRKIKTFKLDRYLRFTKYLILLIFVIILPLVLVNAIGGGAPWFCKVICPAGTLEGGIPLVITNPVLQKSLGFLFSWKLAILIITIIMSILIYRPFCKWLCPLGAIYALFNKISIYKYHISEQKCTSCGSCKKTCPMDIDPVYEKNHLECVRCGACKKACPSAAITSGFISKKL
jgi:polyferredoxin